MRKKQAATRNGSRTECPNCGSVDLSTVPEVEAFKYGKGEEAVELSATVPLHTCHNCGFQFTDASADDAKHEAICRHLGVYTPNEVVALRTRYGLTRAQFAEITRIGEASIQRWESGQLIQNSGYDQLLFLLNYPANLELLRGRLIGGASIAGAPQTELMHKLPNLADIIGRISID
jgi:putative zinc finger/helix-turn-helix YgiT family protein